MCVPALRHSRENNSIPEIMFSETFSIKNVYWKSHKIKHTAIRYNEILNSIWSKAIVFFLLKILFFLPLANINTHLNFPLTAYWNALRTVPLKLQHMLRHSLWDSICNKSPDHHLYQVHHDQSLLAGNIDCSLHSPWSWCRTDRSKAYFETISWFKEENNFA